MLLVESQLEEPNLGFRKGVEGVLMDEPRGDAFGDQFPPELDGVEGVRGFSVALHEEGNVARFRGQGGAEAFCIGGGVGFEVELRGAEEGIWRQPVKLIDDQSQFGGE